MRGGGSAIIRPPGHCTEFDASVMRGRKGRIVFDVRRWKARSGKRANSENQKGDVTRNYIRFGRDDVV